MPVKYVTYPNGFTEIIADRTPSEEAEWFCRNNKVSKFPSVNTRSSAKQLKEAAPMAQNKIK
jgi:hypothetical protein